MFPKPPLAESSVEETLEIKYHWLNSDAFSGYPVHRELSKLHYSSPNRVNYTIVYKCVILLNESSPIHSELFSFGNTSFHLCEKLLMFLQPENVSLLY